MAQTSPAAPCARPPYGVPQHPSDPMILQSSPRQIRFLDPGYPNEHCVLFVPPGLDKPDGVHHGLALDSCVIAADNRWDGYFTLDREGVQRVPTYDLDLSLDADEYYFHMKTKTAPPNFCGSTSLNFMTILCHVNRFCTWYVLLTRTAIPPSNLTASTSTPDLPSTLAASLSVLLPAKW
ncbi:hypothetical protein LTR43_011917 [Exophiala xenobiotica]